MKPAFPTPLIDTEILASERLLLDIIRRESGTTRADLTQDTDLTAQSISRIVDGLKRRGLIELGEKVNKGRGQPTVALHVVPEAAYSLGFSIMSDAVAGALMDFSGDVLAENKIALPDFEMQDALAAMDSLRSGFAKSCEIDQRRIVGVGVAISGYFIGDGSKFNPPAPMDELALVDLDQTIAERHGVPVWLDNNGNAAAVGEILTGVGRRFESFAYIHHSTGVGGAVVVDRKLLRGRYGNAGEFSGILAPRRLAKRPTLELLRKSIGEQGMEFQNINEMLEDFDPKWPGVDEWIHTVAPQVSAMVTSIASVLDPEAIVLGGLMPRTLAEKLIPHVEIYEGAKRRGYHQPRPNIVPSDVKGDATSIGAAAIPMKACFFA